MLLVNHIVIPLILSQISSMEEGKNERNELQTKPQITRKRTGMDSRRSSERSARSRAVRQSASAGARLSRRIGGPHPSTGTSAAFPPIFSSSAASGAVDDAALPPAAAFRFPISLPAFGAPQGFGLMVHLHRAGSRVGIGWRKFFRSPL